MKNLIKTTIGIIAITFASISVSQADSNRHRDHDRVDRTQNQAKQFERYEKHYQMHRQQRGNHLSNHVNRPHWKHAHWERQYWKHERKRAIKQIHRERAYRRALKQEYRDRAYRSNYGYSRYVAPSHHVTYVSHSHHALPAIAGGLIGSSIANNVSHGDPAATVGGAVFGAIIGNAIARH